MRLYFSGISCPNFTFAAKLIFTTNQSDLLPPNFPNHEHFRFRRSLFVFTLNNVHKASKIRFFPIPVKFVFCFYLCSVFLNWFKDLRKLKEAKTISNNRMRRSTLRKKYYIKLYKNYKVFLSVMNMCLPVKSWSKDRKIIFLVVAINLSLIIFHCNYRQKTFTCL